MRATARAHPNIALVKYWGKRDAPLNLPSAGSLSVTLGGLSTTTTVTFDETLSGDELVLDGDVLTEGRALERVSTFLDLLRQAAGLDLAARVETANDFPTAAGLASSASGFAALAVAATAAAGLDWSPRQLSVLARRGSGSAARSLFGGYVEMNPGTRDDGTDAHATPIASPEHWDLRCLIALTTTGAKKVGSTEGMVRTQKTSPLFQPWIDTQTDDLARARRAIEGRDFHALAAIAERSCLRMHATALGADPGILYWNGTTVELIHGVRRLRDEGLDCFFTIDAGPHVKVFCTPDQVDELRSALDRVEGVRGVVEAHPGPGASVLDDPRES